MTLMTRKVVAFAVLAGAALVAAARPARADFVLKVFDDGVLTNTFSVPSGTAEIFTGTVVTPDFTLTVDARSNSPGSATIGNIKNVTISAKNTGVGSHTLSLALTDQGFNNPPSPTLILRSSATVSWGVDGDTTANTDKVAFTSYVNTNNKLFDSDAATVTTPGQVGNAAAGNNPSATLNFASPGVIGAVASGQAPDVIFPKPGMYSLTSELDVTVGQGNGVSVTGNTNVFPTPEPGSLALLLAGAPAALAWARRRKARA